MDLETPTLSKKSGHLTAFPSSSEMTFFFNLLALPQNFHFIPWISFKYQPALLPCSNFITWTVLLQIFYKFRKQFLEFKLRYAHLRKKGAT